MKFYICFTHIIYDTNTLITITLQSACLIQKKAILKDKKQTL